MVSTLTFLDSGMTMSNSLNLVTFGFNVQLVLFSLVFHRFSYKMILISLFCHYFVILHR